MPSDLGSFRKTCSSAIGACSLQSAEAAARSCAGLLKSACALRRSSRPFFRFVCEIAAQTRICGCCGAVDTDAWRCCYTSERCKKCNAATPAGRRACKSCGAGIEYCKTFGYSGCSECRPDHNHTVKGSGYAASAVIASQAAKDSKQPATLVGHIVEDPGGIETLVDCEVPTEEYNAARVADLSARHPGASAGVLEHLAALEPFLDTSITAGFSYGVDKANIMVPLSD